jgi:hypothetical protein
MRGSIHFVFSLLLLNNIILAQGSFTYKRQLSYKQCDKCNCKKSRSYKLVSSNLTSNQKKCAENDMYATIKTKEILQGATSGGLFAGFNAPQEGCGDDCYHDFKLTYDNVENVRVDECFSESQKQKLANDNNIQEAKIKQQRLQEENARTIERQKIESINRLRELAKKDFENKDYSAATQRINNIFADNGTRTAWDYWCLGMCEIENSDYENALKNFKNGVDYFSNTKESSYRQTLYSEASENLRIAYNTIGWRLLFKKNFSLALQYLKQGADIYPNDLFIIGNLTHAYLLSGNYTVAKQMYIDNKGKSLNSKLSWVSMVNDDFKEFQEKGILNEHFQEILNLMNEISLLKHSGFSAGYYTKEDKVIFNIFSNEKPVINLDVNKNNIIDEKIDKRFVAQGNQSIIIDNRVGEKIDNKKINSTSSCNLLYFAESNSFEFSIPIKEFNIVDGSFKSFQFKKEDKFLTEGKDFNIYAFMEALTELKSLILSNILKCDNYLLSKDPNVISNSNYYKTSLEKYLSIISLLLGETQNRLNRGEGKNFETGSTDDTIIATFREAYKDLKNNYNYLSNELSNNIVHVSFSVIQGDNCRQVLNQGFEKSYYVVVKDVVK